MQLKGKITEIELPIIRIGKDLSEEVSREHRDTDVRLIPGAGRGFCPDRRAHRAILSRKAAERSAHARVLGKVTTGHGSPQD